MVNRDFLKLWIGQTISEIGSRISREGIPYTAVMLLHASPLQMGILSAAGGFAALFAATPAGVIADRFRRKPILIAADLARAALLAVIPLAALNGNLAMPLLLAVAVAAGLLGVFFDVAYQTYFPSLVDSDQLVDGNRRLAMSASTAEAIGPGLTGFLVGWLTAPIAIALDAASFLVSAASLLAIRRPEPPPQGHAADFTWHDAFSGFGIVWRHPILRPFALRTATMSLFGGFFWALYVYFAIDILHFTPMLLGVLVTLGGIGAFTGSWLAGVLVPRYPLGKVLGIAAVTQAFLQLLVPLASGPLWLSALCLGASQLLGDTCFPLIGIHETSLRQRISPPEHLGRVNACNQLLFRGILPIGALLGGLLGSAIGVRPTLFISVIGFMASSAWLVFSPVWRLKAHPVRAGS